MYLHRPIPKHRGTQTSIVTLLCFQSLLSQCFNPSSCLDAAPGGHLSDPLLCVTVCSLALCSPIGRWQLDRIHVCA